jgi:hypothetical protein
MSTRCLIFGPAYLGEAQPYNDYAIPPLTQTLEQMRADLRRQTVFKADRAALLRCSSGITYLRHEVSHRQRDHRAHGLPRLASGTGGPNPPSPLQKDRVFHGIYGGSRCSGHAAALPISLWVARWSSSPRFCSNDSWGTDEGPLRGKHASKEHCSSLDPWGGGAHGDSAHFRPRLGMWGERLSTAEPDRGSRAVRRDDVRHSSRRFSLPARAGHDRTRPSDRRGSRGPPEYDHFDEPA